MRRRGDWLREEGLESDEDSLATVRGLDLLLLLLLALALLLLVPVLLALVPQAPVLIFGVSAELKTIRAPWGSGVSPKLKLMLGLPELLLPLPPTEELVW